MNEPAAAQPAASVSSTPVNPAPSALGALGGRIVRLQAVIAAWRVLYGLELFVAAVLLVLSLVAFSDQWVRFEQDALRSFAAAWWVCGLLGLSGLGWWVWRRTPGRGLLALHLEARERAYAGQLLTAIEALERPAEVPEALAELSAEHAWRLLKQMPPRAICPSMHWRVAHAGLMSALTFFFLGLGLFGSAYWGSFRDAAFPGPSAASAAAQLRICDVFPGDAEIDEGDSLTVDVRCEGSASGPLVLQFRDAKGHVPVEALLKAAGELAWRGQLNAVRKPCEYRVVAYGNASAAWRAAPAATSSWFSVRLRPAQSLRSIAALVEPPAYTGRPAYWLNDPELIEAPARSCVTLLIRAVPASGLLQGQAEVPGGSCMRLERLADEQGVALYRLQFVPERSGLLRFGLRTASEERADVQTLLPIRLVGDLPPDVAAQIPEGALADPQGLPVDLRARDEYGLSAARLVVRRLREGLELSEEAGREMRFDVPMTAGTRTLDERLVIPQEGLDEWLATGFEYRLEALDNAEPKGQLSQSPWQRYEPHKRSQAQSEPGGLFDPPAQRRPRQLARGNALSRLPDPTPDELAQMKGLGSGVDAPRQLRRPQAERLEGPSSGSGSSSGGGAKGSGKAEGASKPGDKGRYDLPQGLPKEQEKEKPQPGGETDTAGGANGKGQEEGTGQGQAQGTGESEGGEPRSGQYQPKDKDPGQRKGEGQGSSPDGKQTADGGEEEDPGGAVGATQTQPGSGPGGRHERDGGPKTGREAGAGRGPMGAPDVATLARMKGLTPEEAEAYARQHGIAAPVTGFGMQTGGRVPRAGEQGVRQAMGRFAVNDPALGTDRKADKDAANAKGESVVRLSWGEIDPVYQPSVEGYFQQWDDWRGKK